MKPRPLCPICGNELARIEGEPWFCILGCEERKCDRFPLERRVPGIQMSTGAPSTPAARLSTDRNRIDGTRHGTELGDLGVPPFLRPVKLAPADSMPPESPEPRPVEECESSTEQRKRLHQAGPSFGFDGWEPTSLALELEPVASLRNAVVRRREGALRARCRRGGTSGS